MNIRDGTISFEEFILYLSITAPTQTEQDPSKIIEGYKLNNNSYH